MYHNNDGRKFFFASGPSKKFPEWSHEIFSDKLLNRTHIFEFREHMKQCLDMMRTILGIPSDYAIFFVPGSGSGAIFCSFLNLIDIKKKMQVPVTGYFSGEWFKDLSKFPGLQCKKIETHDELDPANDSMFVWADTTSGFLQAPIFSDFHAQDDALVFVDAVCAAFLEDIPWQSVDAVSFSMQKILGGDGSLGILVLSPKAIKRLAQPKPWPIGRLFDINRWTLDEITNGRAMSTPSILASIEMLHILKWVEKIGGLKGLQKRNAANWQECEKFLAKHSNLCYSIKDKAYRARALACMELKDWGVETHQQKMDKMKQIATEASKIGIYDIANFANPSWRFWLGPMQEAKDIAEGLTMFGKLFENAES